MSARSAMRDGSKRRAQSCDEGEGELPSSPSSLSVPATQPKYVTLKEATAMVPLSAGTLKRAIRTGKLRAFKPGGKLLVRPEDLCDWVEAREAKVDPTPLSERPATQDSLMDRVLARRMDNS